VDDDHDALARIGRSLYPEMSEMRRRRHERIRAVLTPAQHAAFDALAAQNEGRRRQEIDLPPNP